jgi:hypothetical protein
MRTLFLYYLLSVAAACGGDGAGYFEDAPQDLNVARAEMMSSPATANSKIAEVANEETAVVKKVVKNGGIDFRSENIESDYKALIDMLPRFDAYMENENQSNSIDRIYYSLVIRVPAEKFDSLFYSISSLPVQVENKYSNIEDVTERYYDLVSRIKNKKALEERYLELLKKAVTISDIIEIEKNLNEIRYEIESLEGQFNYLSKQVSLSTLRISFYELLPYTNDNVQRKGFGARILKSMENGWYGFLTFLVGIISLWPFLLLSFPVYYLFKKWKSWRKSKSQ